MSAPPPQLIYAVAGCALFPLILLLLSHGPLAISRPGRRFARAWIVVIAGWAVAAAGIEGADPALADGFTGLLLFGAAVPLSFMLWSVLCWGVTLNMLTHIAGRRHVRSATDWQEGYTGGHGLARLVADRANVLYRLGLARPAPDGSGIAVTATGRKFAILTSAAAWLFSIRS